MATCRREDPPVSCHDAPAEGEGWREIDRAVLAHLRRNPSDAVSVLSYANQSGLIDSLSYEFPAAESGLGFRCEAALIDHQDGRRLKDLVAQLYAAIWTWYIPTVGTAVSWIPRPWYPKKATPSFLDALASLRRMLWAERITPVSSSQPFPPKILDGLLDVLATAA